MRGTPGERTTFRAVRRAVATIRWGHSLWDRALIAAYYGLLIGSRPYRLRQATAAGMHPTFWLGDVRADMPSGRFRCRGRTTDFDIVNPHYEPSIYAILTAQFKVQHERPTVFVDIGAHVGKYSVFAGRALGERGVVVAVEPDPENFSMLGQNLKLNALSNVRPVNIGCWSESGTLRLHRQKGNLGEHSFVVPVGSETMLVPVRTLDAMLTDLGIHHVDIIKMDVQGAEARVLKGASSTLKDCSLKTVIIEETGDPQNSESVRILKDRGFDVSRLDSFNLCAARATRV